MKRKTIHIFLILLLIIGIKQCIHFGDYESGMVQGLLLLFVFSIFFILFLMLLIFDLYKLIKFKKRFDFIPSILASLFLALIWFGSTNNDNPYFWKKAFYKGELYSEDNDGEIYLFKNGTFAFKIRHIEYVSTISGDFKTQNDTLKLFNYNTTKVKNFTNSYLFVKDSSLITLKEGYYDIRKVE